MAEIGERLREARMRQRVDITEVEHATKIRAKYLRALENDEFDVLPGPTFVRSFLRTYAEYLGLDARLLVEEYRVRHEPPPEEEHQRFEPPPQRRRALDYDRPQLGPGWLVGGAVALLLTIFLVIGLIAGGDGQGGSNGDSPSTGEREEGAREGTRRRRSGRRRRGAAAQRSVTMRIVPAEPTYACVDAGPGRIIYQGSVMRPRTFRGRRLRLNLGKTSARVVVNGRPVNLGRGANPVGFAFSPRGRPRPLPLGQRPCA